MQKILDKSPTLKKDLEKLKSEKYKIIYGPSGEGSFLDRKEHLMQISSELRSPEQVVQTLAHETGHFLDKSEIYASSKSTYVNGLLSGEGAATMKNIEIQREILNNGGPDIGVAGKFENIIKYNKAYDEYLNGGSAKKTREIIGNIFGYGEKNSIDGRVYADYYGDSYDKIYGK